MQKSFSEVIRLATFDSKSNAVIASSFVFLSTCVGPQFVAILDHFASPDPTFAERLLGLISKLHHLGVDWLTRLLRTWLTTVSDLHALFGHRCHRSYAGGGGRREHSRGQ
jgi:hypothetical protein